MQIFCFMVFCNLHGKVSPFLSLPLSSVFSIFFVFIDEKEEEEVLAEKKHIDKWVGKLKISMLFIFGYFERH